ncbi:MAG: hypothetical protein ACYTBX_10210 [Planctomycetota bacterium]|jgi:hypothetical protein
MRINLKHLLQRLLRRLRLSPLSLAAKCRLTFGAAVVFTLALALLLPYIWMGQLTKKALLDTGRARSQALLDRHFQLKDPAETALPALDKTGLAIDVNDPEMLWIRFTKENETELPQLTKEQNRMVQSLKANETTDDNIALTKYGYVQIFRASDNCRSCHDPQGSAGPFSPNEMIGAVVIQPRALGGEIRDMKFMNLLFIFVAGLIGGTGAIVAFGQCLQQDAGWAAGDTRKIAAGKQTTRCQNSRAFRAKYRSVQGQQSKGRILSQYLARVQNTIERNSGFCTGFARIHRQIANGKWQIANRKSQKVC